MAHVERSKQFDVSAAEMWGRIGGFQTPDSWHPAIVSCTAEEDGAVRRLTLGDGNVVVERLVGESEHSYTYRILDPGPLPVADYEATITVRAGDGGGCIIDWRANFTAAGAPDAEAETVIAGVFEGGLGAL
ncbi:MAG TPA: SRPBCC family protein [Solirubrobacteraceae bacterium]|nr:SRPBCC family protein [Solirubrobacteraceae bacterium]